MELRSTVGLWVTVRWDGRTGDPIERLRHRARDVSPAVWFGGSGPSKLGVNEWRVTSGESQEEENLDSWSRFCEQAGEVARGDDAVDSLSAFPFRAASSADLAESSVNDSLEFAGVSPGMARLDLLSGAVEDAPTDGLLDEFREVAFLHAPGAKISTQREVGFLGDFDVPANGFFDFFHATPIHTSR